MRRTVVLLASMALAVLLACGVAWAATINCPNQAGNLCVGTDNRDTMYGTSSKDLMRGLGAADTLRARGGADRLSGGDGGDKLGGGDGSDVYAFRKNWGRDYITRRERSGVDTLDFTGVDRNWVDVSLRGRFNSPDVTANEGSRPGIGDPITATIDFTADVVLENVRGTPQGDVIAGQRFSIPNHFWGYRGRDWLLGYGGNDVLSGGPGRDILDGDRPTGLRYGNDTLIGGPGPDFFFGYEGDDTIYAIDGEADLEIACDEGIDTVYYDQGLDDHQPLSSCEITHPR